MTDSDLTKALEAELERELEKLGLVRVDTFYVLQT